jgi:hypothetical protein
VFQFRFSPDNRPYLHSLTLFVMRQSIRNATRCAWASRSCIACLST